MNRWVEVETACREGGRSGRRRARVPWLRLSSFGADCAGGRFRRSTRGVPGKLCRADLFARPLRGPRGAAVRRPPWIPRAPEAPPLDSVGRMRPLPQGSLACLRQTIARSRGIISFAKSKGLRPHERFLTRLPAGRAPSRGEGGASTPFS